MARASEEKRPGPKAGKHGRRKALASTVSAEDIRRLVAKLKEEDVKQ